MGKLISTTYTCDDCGKDKDRAELMLIPLGNEEEAYVCKGCVSYRLGVSMAGHALGSRGCQTCQGHGIFRVPVGPHGDEHEDRQCDACGGTGLNDFGG